MGGGMEVNKNRWIEEWNAGRENLEFNFRWTRRNLAIVGIFGVNFSCVSLSLPSSALLRVCLHIQTNTLSQTNEQEAFLRLRQVGLPMRT